MRGGIRITLPQPVPLAIREYEGVKVGKYRNLHVDDVTEVLGFEDYLGEVYIHTKLQISKKTLEVHEPFTSSCFSGQFTQHWEPMQ